MKIRDIRRASDDQMLSLLRKAAQEQEARLAAITEELRSGWSARQSSLVNEYFKSFAPKFVAASDMQKRLSSEWKRTFSLRHAYTLAQRLDVYSPSSERVLVNSIERSGGGHRTVCNFGSENRARQYLIKRFLEATHEFSHVHGGLRGRGVVQVSRAIQEGLKEGYRWAVVSDIRSCFPSLGFDTIYENLPLPRRVIDNVILPSRYHFRFRSNGNNHIRTLSVGIGGAHTGIPQGSAVSNLVASIVIDRALAGIDTSGALIFIYVDDILVLARTKAEAVSISRSIGSALAQDPIGPLRLLSSVPRRVDHGFWFLGRRYRYYTPPYDSAYAKIIGGRKLDVSIRGDTLPELNRDINDAVHGCSAINRADVNHLRSRISGLCGSYLDVPIVQAWGRKAFADVNSIEHTREYQIRVRQRPPLSSLVST